MPSGFTRDEVARIAALASLELDEGEIDRFARQLGDILRYAEQVQAVETSGVPPTAHVLSHPPTERPDRVRPSLDRDGALGNAPDPAREAGLFRVPRVIG